jgi:hypothetical protein
MQPNGKPWTMRAARPIIWRRCGGRCEVSGKPIEYESFDAHHRRLKGMGGTSRPDRDAPFNLLALHPQVHNPGPGTVHGERDWSIGRGYMIEKHNQAPARRPVLLFDDRWVYLTETEFYVPLPWV